MPMAMCLEVEQPLENGKTLKHYFELPQVTIYFCVAEGKAFQVKFKGTNNPEAQSGHILQKHFVLHLFHMKASPPKSSPQENFPLNSVLISMKHLTP